VTLQEDLSAFLELLNAHRVEYLLVGAHALAYHGVPRYTGDTHFFVGQSATNARKIMDVLEEFGFGGLDIHADDFTRPDQVIQLGVPPNRIDLLTSLTGVTFAEAW